MRKTKYYKNNLIIWNKNWYKNILKRGYNNLLIDLTDMYILFNFHIFFIQFVSLIIKSLVINYSFKFI